MSTTNVAERDLLKVALFTRAWIEITHNSGQDTVKASPSSRGRGLKCKSPQGRSSLQTVALFTRAWIEIIASSALSVAACVALFTRAWIEIDQACTISGVSPTSPSSRGRGLKFFSFPSQVQFLLVALFTRAWIEIYRCADIITVTSVALFTRAWIEITDKNAACRTYKRSPSSRGRGLKYQTLFV